MSVQNGTRHVMTPAVMANHLDASAMLPLAQLEVLNSIVGPVPADVVNSLARQKLPTQAVRHDSPVLKLSLLLPSDSPVAHHIASRRGVVRPPSPRLAAEGGIHIVSLRLARPMPRAEAPRVVWPVAVLPGARLRNRPSDRRVQRDPLSLPHIVSVAQAKRISGAVANGDLTSLFHGINSSTGVAT